MLVKLFSIAFIVFTSGCVTLTNTNKVEIVDKSANIDAIQTEQNYSKHTESSVFSTTYTTTTKDENETKNSSESSNAVEKKTIKANKTWIMPINASIEKGFSTKHQGLSFNNNNNQIVKAIRDGKVIYTGKDMIVIRHPLGFYSAYNNIIVKAKDKQKVDQSDVIGLTSNKNFYFEMKKFKDLIDPIKYLK